MPGREVSSGTYTEIGIPDAHHPLSHHEYKPEKIALMSEINAYHASRFADYLAKLRWTPDGDGSLLDNMLLLYGCAMSDSNAHSPLDLPVLLLGGCAGQLQGGRHLNGLAAGALALALSIVLRDGRFDVMNTRRRPAVWALAWIVIVRPWFFVDDIIELSLSRADEAALALLFGLTGFAAYALACITAMLDHLAGDVRPTHASIR